MASVLSQAEIDELLNTLASGNAEPEPQALDEGVSIRTYDFRTANKFPKEQMRTMNVVFQTFAQLFSGKLSGILRTSVECELLSVEEVTFNEFNNSLPSPVVLGILTSAPMEGNLLMEVSSEAAYCIINRLMGGTAKNNDNAKQFTEIELALLERVLKQVMGVLGDAWEKVLKTTARMERLETSSQFTQIVPGTEAVALVTLDFRVGEESGLIAICIPRSAIEPVSKQLSTKTWYSSADRVKTDEGMMNMLREKVSETGVLLTAYFNDTPATVSDVVNLQVGDVIRLNHLSSEPLNVKVQHIPKFSAEVGVMNNRYAMKIIDIIKGDDRDDDVTG